MPNFLLSKFQKKKKKIAYLLVIHTCMDVLLFHRYLYKQFFSGVIGLIKKLLKWQTLACHWFDYGYENEMTLGNKFNLSVPV